MRPIMKSCFRHQTNSLVIHIPIISFKVMVHAYQTSSFVINITKKGNDYSLFGLKTISKMTSIQSRRIMSL